MRRLAIRIFAVAPPRGERGLKRLHLRTVSLSFLVAPPRGERGLKRHSLPPYNGKIGSLPLVGSVD